MIKLKDFETYSWREWTMYTTVVILILGSLFGVWSFVFKKVGLGDDNFLEEICEEKIEERLGLPNGMIDLTPSTKEKRVI